MEQKITIGNVCFIKDSVNDKILLLKRAKEPMQNMYTGVGGKTDFGESINESCTREAKEETGLDISDVKLKGVIKTVLDGSSSSWVLFIYTTDKFDGEIIDCVEGELNWVPMADIFSYELIGFIRRILPHILSEQDFVEGLILHDIKGNIIEEKLIIA